MFNLSIDYKKISIAVLEILALILITTTILSIFGIYSFNASKIKRYEDLNETLKISSEQLQNSLILPLWNIDESQIIKLIESSMKNPSVYTVKVIAFDKVFIRTRGKHWELSSGPEQVSTDYKLIETMQNIYFTDEFLGKVHITVTTKYIDELIRKNAMTYLIFILILDLCLIYSLYRIHTQIVLKPLLAIEYYANKVSTGEYSTQLRYSKVFPKELESLKSSIEKMVIKLNTRFTELKKAKEIAETTAQAKTVFLNTAAHELKTPISSLKLLTQKSIRDINNGIPVSLKVLRIIDNQSSRLTNLVNDLLDTAKLDSELLTLRIQSIDINTLIDQSVRFFRGNIDFKRITVFKMNPTINIEIDPEKISDVLINLIDNAIKYTPSDSPIEIKTERRSVNQIRFLIIDHGKGISTENSSSIFDRFFRIRSDETIRFSGLGLGLYQCRRIIEIHGGELNLESKIDIGSIFYFDIPIKRKIT